MNSRVALCSKIFITVLVLLPATHKAMAQESKSACAESLDSFFKLSIHLEKQIFEDRAQLPKQFNKEAYWSHMREFSQIVDAGRKHLSDCSQWDSTEQETIVLNGVAGGLLNTEQPEDAIPVFKHCLGFDHNNAACLLGLGESYSRICDFDDAKRSFAAVLEIGGFNEESAKSVEVAKLSLSNIDTPEKQKSTQDLYKCSVPSQESASGGERFGSGFFVSKSGYIVTNNHVVEGCKTLTAAGGKPLIVVDRHPSVDLALLKMDGVPDAVAVFRSGPAVKAGDTVFAFGFPLPDVLSSEGNFSMGILSATSGIHNDVRFIQISAPVQPGNSGGPLLDSAGHVIGVVVAKLNALAMARDNGDIPQNVNFAIHWTEVKAFLDEEGIAYVRAPSPTKREPSQIAENVKKFSLKIDCTE